MSTFVNVYTIENVNGGLEVVKKRQNRVNVVCEQTLMLLLYRPTSVSCDLVVTYIPSSDAT